MKKTLIVTFLVVAGLAHAGHPRCVGSYESAKCEAFEADLAKESPAQRHANAARLEVERDTAMKVVQARQVYQYDYNSKQKVIGQSEATDTAEVNSMAWRIVQFILSVGFIFGIGFKLANKI